MSTGWWIARATSISPSVSRSMLAGLRKPGAEEFAVKEWVEVCMSRRHVRSLNFQADRTSRRFPAATMPVRMKHETTSTPFWLKLLKPL